MHSLIHEQKGIIPCYFNLLLFANMQRVKDSVSSLINSKNKGWQMDPLRPSRCGILKHFRCSCYFDCSLEILLGLTTGTTAPALLSGSNTIWYWKWGQNIREPNLASRAGSEWWMYWCGWRKLSLPWAVYLCTVGSTTRQFVSSENWGPGAGGQIHVYLVGGQRHNSFHKLRFSEYWFDMFYAAADVWCLHKIE